ncbi:HlyD family type I secretion periplasmic adaptor subunit [Pseudomonas sp. H9]|uniref:HlyD family type I secretion periplasmic adaptor subunit n=1 Tax=Pseudomonas sp. H9 TaxID=483968 RepID=UPI0010577542|nr:HlyD family type I secretion periplasmic adaptor subunit [Pseudomonas sp. H9]TDF83793.1 HlyD family type I secretion periplasmic adaptor subunit [Pseudomonas sp. H9]
MNTSKPLDIVSITGAADSRGSANIASLLQEGHTSHYLRRLLLGIVALVLLLLLWSLIAQVDELAKARGDLQPVGRVQSVQSEEGGTLSELYVRTYQHVNVGQPIARFTAPDLTKQRAQAQVKRAALQIDLERWGAIVDSREPDFSAYSQYPELIEAAKKLHQQQSTLFQAKVNTKQTALEQQKAALAGARSELSGARQQANLAQDVLKRYREGLARHVISAVRVAEVEEHATEVSRNLTQLQTRIQALEKAVDQASAELVAARSEPLETARAQRSEILLKVHELDAELQALQTRHGQSELRAPIAGFIHSLPDTRVGAVIPPGGTVAEIVPSAGGVLMEARVSPRDIGYVHSGQLARVKIDAYDYSRFGSVEAKVTHVSPSAFREERSGEAYYKVDLQLAQAHVGDNEKRLLIPGMTGEVDIVTGQKSVFQYLAKPVFTSTESAFHER